MSVGWVVACSAVRSGVTVLDAALDLLLGSRCAGCDRPGRALCAACIAGLPIESITVRPTPAPEGLIEVHAAGAYEHLLRNLIVAHKDRNRLALARPLGLVLAAVIGATLVHRSERVVLVPVPSTPRAIRQRGQDPMLRIARRAAAELRRAGVCSARVWTPLSMARRPIDQAGLARADRFANLDRALTARVGAAEDGVGRNLDAVVLVDDVITTGATLREAQRALEQVGIAVDSAACIAATQRRDQRRVSETSQGTAS